MCCVILLLNCLHPISSSLLQDCSQVVTGEDSEASAPIVVEKKKNQQSTTNKNRSTKSITEVSITDAETNDEGVNPYKDEDGMDVRGQSQTEDDHDLKVLVNDMLCTLIPVYGKVLKRSDH